MRSKARSAVHPQDLTGSTGDREFRKTNNKNSNNDEKKQKLTTKWKETCKKWILGSTTLGRTDFNIWQVEFTNLCYSYWRETSYSFRDLYLLRHAAVFLQHGNKFARAYYSSSSVIKIDMNWFKLLTDNYSEHSIRKAISLEHSFILKPPLTLFFSLLFLWLLGAL